MQSVEIYPNTETLVRAAAERITSILRQTLAQKESATLVLTGGSTPRPVYELMGSPPYAGRVAWNRVHFFWGDERCVPPDHPQSNFGMAWEALVSKIPVPSGHVHRMRGEIQDAEMAASLYATEIQTVIPDSEIPSFDLVLLGMGKDGHTASLFPGTRWDEEKLVIASQVPETGAKRISMTTRIFNKAHAGLFLVAGLDKSQVLAEVLKNPASGLPAAGIRPEGSLTWMVDEAAARLVRE